MAVEAAGFYLGAVAAEGDGEGGAAVGDVITSYDKAYELRAFKRA